MINVELINWFKYYQQYLEVLNEIVLQPMPSRGCEFNNKSEPVMDGGADRDTILLLNEGGGGATTPSPYCMLTLQVL